MKYYQQLSEHHTVVCIKRGQRYLGVSLFSTRVDMHQIGKMPDGLNQAWAGEEAEAFIFNRRYSRGTGSSSPS